MSTSFGVNVPYLRGEYGHDLAENGRFPTWPCRFDPTHAYRPLIEARRMGFTAVRMWLCENAEGLRVDDQGRVEGVRERLLESVKIIQEAALLNGLHLYFCLLDGNAWPREGDTITRSILADRDQAARFAEHVVAEITRALDPACTLALEIVNEPETSTAACIDDPAIEPVAWEDIGRAIRLAREAARAEVNVPVTSGTTKAFLPKLWQCGAQLDAIDVHVYHEDGGIPSREDLARYVGDDGILDPSLPIIGGELGIPKNPGPKEPASLANYIHNAARLGYAAAFLWQLEGDLISHDLPKRPRTWLGEQVTQTLREAR
jgi:hypothetical protein